MEASKPQETQDTMKKFYVKVRENLVDDCPIPGGFRISTHEVFLPVSLRLDEITLNVASEIRKTYEDEKPPEVRDHKIQSIIVAQGELKGDK